MSSAVRYFPFDRDSISTFIHEPFVPQLVPNSAFTSVPGTPLGADCAARVSPETDRLINNP